MILGSITEIGDMDVGYAVAYKALEDFKIEVEKDG